MLAGVSIGVVCGNWGLHDADFGVWMWNLRLCVSGFVWCREMMLTGVKKAESWNCDSPGGFSVASLSTISDASCEIGSPDTTASLR